MGTRSVRGNVAGAGLLLFAALLAGCVAPTTSRINGNATPAAAAPAAATPTALSGPPGFDATAAIADVADITAIGPRPAGSDEESRAAGLIAARLRDMGYGPEIREFTLPNTKTSRNVVVRAMGSSKRVIVVGAHMDSVSWSPGAEDNASGCASLLEIARAMAGRPHYATVEFVFFGSEERIDDDETHDMAGSAAYVRSLSAGERAAVVGMIDMDCVGFGTQFSSVTMGEASQKLSNLLIGRSEAAGVTLVAYHDNQPLGMSDHASFERAGIPAVFLWWHDDGRMHTPQDTVEHLEVAKVRAAGELVLGLLLNADETMCDKLAVAPRSK